MGSVEMNGNVMMKETVQLGVVGSRVAVAVETLSPGSESDQGQNPACSSTNYTFFLTPEP